MNPNLRDLAKETKNPELKADYARISPLCFMIDNCEKIGLSLNDKVFQAAAAIMRRAVNEKVCSQFGMFEFGRDVRYRDGFHSDPTDFHKMPYVENGFSWKSIDQWAETWPKKPNMIVIADGCHIETIRDIFAALRHNMESACLVYLEDKPLYFESERFKHYDCGRDLSKIKESLDDFYNFLKQNEP
jgi:hypothetical protein